MAEAHDYGSSIDFPVIFRSNRICIKFIQNTSQHIEIYLLFLFTKARELTIVEAVQREQDVATGGGNLA